MKVVMQCAARKDPSAGSLRDSAGRPILFVAHPTLAPANTHISYARPDDQSGNRQTWRERLLDYNASPGNALGLLPAYELYMHDAYRALAEGLGIEKLFILSAGWGLIPASFLTPCYDITFSASAEKWKRRRMNDQYADLCLTSDDDDAIAFIGGKSYLPLFCSLTKRLRGRKIVFFNLLKQPELAAGFEPVRYRTTTRTNWHYQCARDLAAGAIAIG